MVRCHASRFDIRSIHDVSIDRARYLQQQATDIAMRETAPAYTHNHDTVHLVAGMQYRCAFAIVLGHQ